MRPIRDIMADFNASHLESDDELAHLFGEAKRAMDLAGEFGAGAATENFFASQMHSFMNCLFARNRNDLISQKLAEFRI